MLPLSENFALRVCLHFIGYRNWDGFGDSLLRRQLSSLETVKTESPTSDCNWLGSVSAYEHASKDSVGKYPLFIAQMRFLS